MLFQYVRACLSFVAHFDINAPAGRERRAEETGRGTAQRPSPRRAQTAKLGFSNLLVVWQYSRQN